MEKRKENPSNFACYSEWMEQQKCESQCLGCAGNMEMKKRSEVVKNMPELKSNQRINEKGFIVTDLTNEPNPFIGQGNYIPEEKQHGITITNVSAPIPDDENNTSFPSDLDYTVTDSKRTEVSRKLFASGNDGREKLEQLFENSFDCYADTWEFDTVTGKGIEGDSIMAMTKEQFVKTVTDLLSERITRNDAAKPYFEQYEAFLKEDNNRTAYEFYKFLTRDIMNLKSNQ